MFEIKLDSYGVVDTIRDVKDMLKEVSGSNVSKKNKDIAICKAVGALDTLWSLIHVVEVVDSTLEETSND